MAELAETRRAWEPAFLAALSHTHNVAASCKAAGVSRNLVYTYRKASPDFAALWSEALDDAVDLLQMRAWQRATDGQQKIVLHQGQPVFVYLDAGGRIVPGPVPGGSLKPLYESRTSDALLMFLLRSHRSEVYGPLADELRKVEAAAVQDDTLADVETAYERAQRDFAEATARAAERMQAGGKHPVGH